jgi:primosomal protein N' (replication factor Y)
VRVVPDLPAFAVDDGFAYAVPQGLDLRVGTVVRIPLGGRRVRGWVVADDEPEREGLREVLGASGDLPVFTPGLLEVLRWAALHYVAPLSTLITKAAPPNLPRRHKERPLPPPEEWPPSSLAEVSAAAASGGRVGSRYMVGRGPWAREVAGLAGPALAAERSVVVVAPSLAEATELGAELGRHFGEHVLLASSSQPAAQLTRTWVTAASSPGRLLVGTREVCFWPVAGLCLAIVIEEGRRGMKDKSTPTTHARDVLWRRAIIEKFSLVLVGAVPTAEALHRAPVLVRSPGRPWGLIEVVDRTEEPPGGGVLTERVRRALASVLQRGGRIFLFTDRRAPAMRCVRCRTLRVCPDCGARPEGAATCPRCGAVLGGCVSCGARRFEPLGAPVGRVLAEAARCLGESQVGEVGSRRPVIVGTERDLPGLEPVDLAVVTDADGVLRAPHYRAVEDGFRLLARVAAATSTGSGRRTMVQTSDPGHPALSALRRGDPVSLVEVEAERRGQAGLPPAGELLALEVGDAPEGADGALRETIGAAISVHGPAGHKGRLRWLVQGRDLRTARVALRRLVAEWRDGGARVRVDADPIDL